jgi:hypothetical protein
MKNPVKLVGVYGIVMVIGFMAACLTDNNPTKIPDYDELREAVTDGRLTITGLSDYEGQLIAAHVTLYNVYLVACESISHAYLNGEFLGYVGESVDSTVNNGQVTLKVFKETDGSRWYENYDGNDQDITFHVGIWDINDVGIEGVYSVYGTVTVNFTNGIGSGVFVLAEGKTE